MFLYVRKSFMIFKIVLACIAFLAAIIALLGTSQNSLLLTQETGKQLGVVMALVFGIITIVEAFMAPPEAIISDKIISGWKTAPDTHSPMVGMQFPAPTSKKWRAVRGARRNRARLVAMALLEPDGKLSRARGAGARRA